MLARIISLLRDSHVVQRWGPVLLWMVGIFYFSSQSSLPSPFSSRYGTFLHGVSHFGEYAILAALLYRALHSPEGGVQRSTFSASFVIGVVYALFDELHQGLVPGRDAELADVVVDVAGIWVALVGIRGWYQFRGGGKGGKEDCSSPTKSHWLHTRAEYPGRVIRVWEHRDRR